MRLSSWRWARGVQILGLACCGVVTACDNSPVPVGRNQDLTNGEEVYRMFCMRVAREAFPNDPSGYQFVGLCEGTTTAVPPALRSDAKGVKFAALIDKRADTVAALGQVLGEQSTADTKPFANDELKAWLQLLLPFYGPEGDTVLPRSTQALAKVMKRLTDPTDASSQEVLNTIARISQRQGYRAPERVLAAVRPTLSYDRLDELTKALLGLVKDGAGGHAAFMGVLEAAALELASPAEPKEADSTLSLALQLLLQPNDLYVVAEAPTTLAPLLVLARDEQGNAVPAAGGSTATPFAVAGRSDSAQRDSVTGLAQSGGADAYETFDANQTGLASLMRDSIPLIRRGTEPRSTVEKLLRMSRPLLGKSITRTETFGANTLSYPGQDVEHGPMAGFLHAFTTLLKLPQTRPLLEVVNKLLETDEKSATELIYAALQIHEESKKPEYDTAVLGSGQPHEFWDDLLNFGLRMFAEREGLWADVLESTTNPLTAAQGLILAHQMQNKDVVKLASETDVNSDVTTGCTATDGMSAPAYCVPVDRSMPDKGMNRSLFQRTLSLIHATYLAPNCNKEGATLTVKQPVETTFPNPPLGPLAPIIGALGGGSGDCPTSTVAPPPATSYKACTLISQRSGTVTLMQAILGKAKVNIKDEEVTKCAKAVGTDVDTAQERESGITGFDTTPAAKPLARFVHAPRSKFLTDIFDPLPTIDSKVGALVSVNEYEPNGIYPLEVIDPAAIVDGKPNAFLTAVVPLLSAFDKHETFDANGDHIGSYLFAELFDLIHMHYSSPKAEPCAVPVVAGNEGCVQSADSTLPFYSKGSNLVSYEPLIIWSLLNQDILGVLQRSTIALKNVRTDDGSQDGVQALNAFLQALLTPNPDVTYLDGRDYAKTNTCVVETSPEGVRGCQGNVGRVIQGGVPPLYLLLDALTDLDSMWASNKDSHELYLQVRSTLVDQLLDVTKNATDGSTALTNRRAYALTRRLVPWLIERIVAHQGDLASWADGLIGRLGKKLGHPLAARGMDLFDKFWENAAAGDEVAKLLTYLLDEKENPEAFTGAIIALSDTLTFLDKDPDLTPAIRFAALALAEDALDTVNKASGTPNIAEGTAYRFLEVTRLIGDKDDNASQLSTLAKLLRNAVVPMPSGKSPLEAFIDIIADVNRLDPTEPTEKSLAAADDKQVFEKLNDFLSNDEVGLERLYSVIENRDIK